MDPLGCQQTSAGNEDSYVTRYDAAGNRLWRRRFGDPKDDRAYRVAVGSDGSIVVGGDFKGTVDFGGGAHPTAGLHDVYVVSLAPDGSHQWSRTFGDSADQFMAGVAVQANGTVVLIVNAQLGSVDFGGGPLAVTSNYATFVAALDSSGNHLWSKVVNGAKGLGLAVDASGAILLTGFTYGTVDFGGGPLVSAGGSDIFIAKLDAGGNHVWSKRFGDTNNRQLGKAIAADGAGNVVVTGGFEGAVDFGGGPLTTSGGIYTDAFVAKLDVNGNHIFSKRFGDAAEQSGVGVAVDSGGNIVVTGSFEGTVDLGGGSFTSAGLVDTFLLKLDPAGNHQWSQPLAGAGMQQVGSVACDHLSNILIVGTFDGTMNLGGAMLGTSGSADVFFGKLAP